MNESKKTLSYHELIYFYQKLYRRKLNRHNSTNVIIKKKSS